MTKTKGDARPGEIEALLDAGRLETVADLCGGIPGADLRNMIDDRIARLMEKIAEKREAGEIRTAGRLDRRRGAFEIFRIHGMDPKRLIRRAVLPAGYHGKILLAAIRGRRAGRCVCLRSGDEWHREILRSTMEEMADLGFEKIAVAPAGGAWVTFDEGNDIVIYGSSRDYGACDKHLAAELIGTIHPAKRCRIRP